MAKRGELKGLDFNALDFEISRKEMTINTRISKVIAYLEIFKKGRTNTAINLQNWESSLTDPTAFYLDAFRYFYFNLPGPLKDHKKYFSKKSRGFGEKAFHTMWYLLYKKYRFTNFLEIGIYRGQTISLAGLLSKMHDDEIVVHGISPFDQSGDAVSRYMQIDYLQDVYQNFEKFALKRPVLIKAYSTDKVAEEVIASTAWDCIYIDGSHEYEVAKKDWQLCSSHIRIGGIIVMDDASLYTSYEPPFFAFKGHPGPSRVADEIKEDKNFKETLRVGHNRVFERIS